MDLGEGDAHLTQYTRLFTNVLEGEFSEVRRGLGPFGYDPPRPWRLCDEVHGLHDRPLMCSKRSPGKRLRPERRPQRQRPRDRRWEGAVAKRTYKAPTSTGD